MTVTTIDCFSSMDVQARFTDRNGGVSQAPYNSLNLGTHVGDDPLAVAQNRALLNLPKDPVWLNQVHSNICLDIDAGVTVGLAADNLATGVSLAEVTADASFTRTRGTVLAIMVADCLPILMAAPNGDVVAVVHAGWRGLANGVIENAIAAMGADKLEAWIGPAIGACHYVVGADVRAEFQDEFGFTASADKNKYWMNPAGIAERQLARMGVRVTQSGECTHCASEQYFSYRRDGVTGRMSGFIWLA